MRPKGRAGQGKWTISPLNAEHRRDNFDCGERSLNDYLKRYGRQNARRGIGRTYVANADMARH